MGSYCPNCGNPVNKDQEVCLQCGNQLQTKKHIYKESGTFGWAVLGFLFPIVGLVLYLVWKEDRPKASSSAGKGALIGFVLGLVYMAFVMTIAIPAIGNQL